MKEVFIFLAGALTVVVLCLVREVTHNSVDARFARLREEFKRHIGRPVEVFNSDPTGTLYRVISVGDDHAVLDGGNGRGPIMYQFACMAGVKPRYLVSKGKIIPTVGKGEAPLMARLLSGVGR